jgi:2-haloacid dehalogenase
MTTPRAVIFDIGNVLITWNPEAFYDRVFGKARRQALFDAVDLHGMNEEIDAGGPFQGTVAAWAARYPQWANEIQCWHDNWAELASPAISESWALMGKLQARGVPVYALTNFGDETFAYAQSAPYPQLGQFDRAYISGRMGVTKPSAQIYAMVEEDCGLHGAALFFTDDRDENIAAAAARGWQTHLFKSADGLAAALQNAGLLD